MITVVPITTANSALFKEVRLRALQDTPSAFGATYASESQLTDKDWLNRTIRWNGDRGIGFLAMDDAIPCGIAGCFLDENDPTRAKLISMWTAPTHRRLGVGRRLVAEVQTWARSRNALTLLLMVTSSNKSAIQFYERLGFAFTSHTEPYPNDPALIEHEMSVDL
jgi:ribosomal protein S18 acetylase RimI-like enzyme